MKAFDKLNEKEKILFSKCLGKDNPHIEVGLLAYLLVKRNKLRRALEIGTNSWFTSLCMALGGAWVVTLSNKPTLPGRFGVLTAYKDKVFQVNQNPKIYIGSREAKWDIIVINEGEKEYLNDRYTKYMIHGGLVYEKGGR